MNAFLIALLNPISHAFANHLDKYIISRYLKNSSIGALVLITSLFSVVTLPVILAIHPGVLTATPFLKSLVLAVNGAFIVLSIALYFYALAEDETSLVAPFFQLIPVFGFILGFLVLKETLLGSQLAGGALIVIGGAFLSINFSGEKIKIRKKVALLMFGSSLLGALNSIIFKSVAIQQGFLDSLFWDMSGKFIFGLILLFAAGSFRKDLVNIIKHNRASVIGFVLLTEILTLLGEVALALAVLYAPVALVQSVGGLQPLFVLMIGVALTLFFPKFARESLRKKDILQKAIGVAVITCGVYFLSF